LKWRIDYLTEGQPVLMYLGFWSCSSVYNAFCAIQVCSLTLRRIIAEYLLVLAGSGTAGIKTKLSDEDDNCEFDISWFQWTF